jgi:N-methylhydantoinase A
MVGAIKIVSTGRGHEVRDCTLIAYGGAGPMFSTQIASELCIPNVIIPLTPGNFCAAGMLQTEIVHQHLKPVRVMTSETTIANLRSMFRGLEKTAKEQFISEGFAPKDMHFEEKLAMRYPKQHFTLELPLKDSIEDLEKEFYRAHHEMYRFAFSDPVLITDLIINGYSTKPKAVMRKDASETKEPRDALIERRRVWFKGELLETPVYRRNDVAPSPHFRGPLIFEELGSTTVVQPGWTARVDDLGNLNLEKEG